MTRSVEILDLFIDPVTKKSLKWIHKHELLITDDGGYKVKNGIIDFYRKIPVDSSDLTVAKSNNPTGLAIDISPELRSAHESAFSKNEGSGGNIYGSLEDLPAITQSGHYRRIKLLSDIDLGDLDNKTVVDFGTGPWGFAAVFPKLKGAKYCIGFDVSLTALQIARSINNDEGIEKTIFATSEGDVIPLAVDTVDIFFGGEVIEHVRNPYKFIQEIARVCKDDAIVILSTPNRDAILYRANNIQYCVGPEHIALLSYKELLDLLEQFTDEIQIVGYETSLGPGLDSLPLDPGTCTSLQHRSANFPELSSGLVSYSRINKEKFKKNKRDITLKETVWSSHSVKYNYSPESLVLFDNIRGALLQGDNQATIEICTKDISLLFWGHDWSGFVEITCGEKTVQQDLYSPGGGFIRVNINNNTTAKSLTIRCIGKKRNISNADQVIFYKVIEYIEENCK